MEWLIKVSKEVYVFTGVPGIIFLVAFFVFGYLIYDFGKKLNSIIIDAFLDKKRCKPTDCIVFSRIDILLKYTIPGLRIICPLRSAIFKDLLEIYFKNVRESLWGAISSDLQDYNPSNFESFWIQVISDSMKKSREEMKDRGIPEVAIDKFCEYNRSNINTILLFIKDVSNSTIIYDTNREKSMAIMNFLASFYDGVIFAVEKTIDKLNGELSSAQYCGQRCTKSCKIDCGHKPR